MSVITELPLEIPGVVVSESNVSELEQTYMLRNAQGGMKATESDSILLKLFQAALKADQAQRALEIARDMQLKKVIQGAMGTEGNYCELTKAPF